LTETDLLYRARQGDGMAWEVLVRQHQEPAFRLAYLILGDPAQAEDVAQEAFIRAYQHMDKYDPARPFRPWLLAITANLARNQLRSVGRYLAAVKRLIDGEPQRIKKQDPEHLENKISSRWQSRTMWHAIQRLDDKDQQIIYLRYYLELPVAETASVLDIAEGTVKSRLHRALVRLQTIIERDFPALLEGFER
jgi:RNA polymerase sigma-70 factor (ECF subfamily)